MDLSVKKVIGMTWSLGQVTQLQNQAFKSYPQICFKCSFANTEKYASQRVRIPHALGIRSERKIKLFSNHVSATCSFPPFRIYLPFGSELSNTRMIVNFNRLGLMGVERSSYFCSVTRSFCHIPRAGTRNHIVWTEDGGSGMNNSIKPLNKLRKSLMAYPAQKENAKTVEELASSGSEVKAIGLGNAIFSSQNGQIVKDVESPMVGGTTKATKGKEKVKQQSRSKKKQNQPSSAATSAEAARHPHNSVEVPPPKEASKKRYKQPAVPLQISSTSTIVTKAADSDSVTKKVPEMVSRSSTKKKKSNAKVQSNLEKEAERTEKPGVPSIRQKSSLLEKTKPPGQKAWRQLYPPLAKSVVVVESVTKAKVIQGYLGELFEVVPSYGHVRDLAARSGSVRPDDDFSMVWEIPSAAWSHLKSMKVALSGAENLILATDPDREGEAIAWHIVEMLRQQDSLPDNVTVARVFFHEITESSIKTALLAPREIDSDLVDAYLARRALDYLIGFNVSPLLWRKLPGCQSAGRVQSAALALICDREREIDGFNAQEYWTFDAQFRKNDPNSAINVYLSAHLTHLDSIRLKHMSIGSNEQAKDVQEKIHQSNFVVIGSKLSQARRNPPTPFITSSLQQDAANKLHFSASYTMKVAQKLYEGIQISDGNSTGLITYMRTDGLHLSDQAAEDIHSFVAEKYGLDFAAKSMRRYFKKVKNAQEAHEAIRPTDIRRLPSKLVGVLDEDALKLYTLIWSRTLACQMEPAVIEQIQCDIGNKNQSTMFRSTSSRVGFLGFQAVYEDAETTRIRNDEAEANEHNSGELFDILSNLKGGQSLNLIKVELGQHYTQPPPRYNEGSLVRKLEELGIGRPSTYATTIRVLKDRNYITTKSRTLYPEFRGRMVSAFLSHYFSEVTDYSFTADMETELDNVSAGITEWKGLLGDYWTRFSKYCEGASKVHIHQVEKMLEKTFGDFLFSSLPDGSRTCPGCEKGTLIFKVSRFGAGYFIGCDKHPNCKYIAKTLYGEDEEEIGDEEQKKNAQEPKLLGLRPGSKEKVLLKSGPYGHYVQLGDDRKGHSPKRVSASQIKDVDSITLEDALKLLQYPITVGNHPDDNRPIILRLAKVGFSIKHRSTITPVPKNIKPDDITLEKALELLKSKGAKHCGRPKRREEVIRNQLIPGGPVDSAHKPRARPNSGREVDIHPGVWS